MPRKFRCPYCNSLTNKAGFRDDIQRYKCRKCGKKSTELTEVKLCIYCGQPTKKYGHLKTGEQRYYCKSCDKSFSEHTYLTGKICTCGGTFVKAGFTAYGTQRYLCKSCGRKVIDNI